MVGAALGFAMVAGLLTMVPGIDTALVLRASVQHGRRAAYATVLGISVGLLAWAVAAAVGVSALLAASRLAYDVLRLAGAAYLVGLGLVMIRQSWLESSAGAMLPRDPAPLTFTSFRRGLLTNLLNPKIGLFYTAVLPQFIPTGAPQVPTGLLLAMVHVAESVVWFSLLIWGTGLLGQWLQRPAVRVWQDRVTGGVLVGFGVKVALTRT